MNYKGKVFGIASEDTLLLCIFFFLVEDLFESNSWAVTTSSAAAVSLGEFSLAFSLSNNKSYVFWVFENSLRSLLDNPPRILKFSSTVRFSWEVFWIKQKKLKLKLKNSIIRFYKLININFNIFEGRWVLSDNLKKKF